MQKWLGDHLNESGIAKIRESVIKAEAHTVGDILPMIVRASSVPRHLALLLFFIFVGTANIFLTLYYLRFGADAILEVQLVVVVASSFLAGGLARLQSVQRFLTPKTERMHSAAVRAEIEFHRSQVSHTGVLLFVSLLERQAIVLAEEKLASKLPEHTWDGVLKKLTDGLKEKDFARGFIAAIEETGEILQKHFPAEIHAKSDVPNDLQIKD